MARAVIVKKEEKVTDIFKLMGDSPSEELFIKLFKEHYPKEWQNVIRTYEKEEIRSKGKKHPMPEPNKYMSNMYKIYYKKLIG